MLKLFDVVLLNPMVVGLPCLLQYQNMSFLDTPSEIRGAAALVAACLHSPENFEAANWVGFSRALALCQLFHNPVAVLNAIEHFSNTQTEVNWASPTWLAVDTVRLWLRKGAAQAAAVEKAVDFLRCRVSDDWRAGVES